MDTKETVDFGLVRLTPEQMLAYRPPDESQDYVEILIEKSKAGTITEAETAELDYYVEFDHLIRMMKNRAAKVLAARRAA